MGIDCNVFFGIALDAGNQDLMVGENENCDLLFRPFCEKTGKKSKYWIPNRNGSFKLDPSPCGDEIKIVLPGFCTLPTVIEDFLSKHDFYGVREVIYMEYYS